MNIIDLRKIKSLIDFKLSVKPDLETLKQLKQESDHITNNNELNDFIRKLYFELNLKDLYQSLGIEQPDFNSPINDNIKISKDYFKWG